MEKEAEVCREAAPSQRKQMQEGGNYTEVVKVAEFCEAILFVSPDEAAAADQSQSVIPK